MSRRLKVPTNKVGKEMLKNILAKHILFIHPGCVRYTDLCIQGAKFTQTRLMHPAKITHATIAKLMIKADIS